MIVSVNVVDEINPFFASFLAKNKDCLEWTSKSVGNFIRARTQEEVKLGAPGGRRFKERTPHRKVRSPLAKAHNKSAPVLPYGKMRRAIGYAYENGGVNVGWTSKTASAYGKIQEEGTKRQVTERMRSLYRMANVKLGRNKQYITVPERPVFEPMSAELFPLLPEYVENKVMSYMNGDIERGKKNPRRYRVY